MRQIPPMMCSKPSEQYKDTYREAIERYAKRQKGIEKGIEKGILNIILANKCSYFEAESILESVKSILKSECMLCLREGVKK